MRAYAPQSTKVLQSPGHAALGSRQVTLFSRSKISIEGRRKHGETGMPISETIERILPFRPEQLFEIASDVERYPEFVPGWIAVRVRDRHAGGYCTDQILGLGPKTLVVKRGEYGVLMITRDAIFAAPAYPLENVFDPTGAGDTFAGGFLGYLASRSEIHDKDLRRSIIFGSRVARQFAQSEARWQKDNR